MSNAAVNNVNNVNSVRCQCRQSCQHRQCRPESHRRQAALQIVLMMDFLLWFPGFFSQKSPTLRPPTADSAEELLLIIISVGALSRPLF
jgi:hypothetical protein